MFAVYIYLLLHNLKDIRIQLRCALSLTLFGY